MDSQDATDVTKKLKEEVDEIQKTLIPTSLENTCEDELDTIYSTHFLDYQVYTYKEFVTLVVQESLYTCEKGISVIQKLHSYTFNVLTGEQIEIANLLNQYDKTLTDAIQNVRKSLNTLQDESSVQIEETIQNLKENDTYTIYIDQDGNLVMKYIVKTNLVDYNDTIVLNG